MRDLVPTPDQAPMSDVDIASEMDPAAQPAVDVAVAAPAWKSAKVRSRSKATSLQSVRSTTRLRAATGAKLNSPAIVPHRSATSVSKSLRVWG